MLSLDGLMTCLSMGPFQIDVKVVEVSEPAPPRSLEELHLRDCNISPDAASRLLQVSTMPGAGCKAQGAGCRVQGAGCRVGRQVVAVTRLQVRRDLSNSEGVPFGPPQGPRHSPTVGT